MAKRKKVKKKQPQNYTLILVTLFVFLLLLFVFSKKYEPGVRVSTTKSTSQTEKLSTQSAKLNVKPPQTPTPQPQYYGFCLNVPILMYHHIKPLSEAGSDAYLTVDTSIFDAQMQYLVGRGYHTISVDELVSALINHQQLPSKSIVITLDDGYADIYTDAYPLLYKYQLKANLMIPTGLLGNSGYIKWDELKRMVETGLIYAYDHTWSHASLANLPDEKIKYEILTAKKQLEEKLGKQINIFAYPYGSENQKTVDILKQNGFIAALSTNPGFTQCDSFIMALHRTRIGNANLSQYGI